MNIGNLYLVKKWYWMLFPSKETAAPHTFTANANLIDAADASGWAAYYSKLYNCEVTYFSPDSHVVFLEEDGMLKQVLTADGKVGWTVFEDRFNDCFEEMKP